MEKGVARKHREGSWGGMGRRGYGGERLVALPSLPRVYGMMQGRQWDLAHDEEDHLGALVSGQRAGKGPCGEEMEEGVSAGEACSCQGLRRGNYCAECRLCL